MVASSRVLFGLATRNLLRSCDVASWDADAAVMRMGLNPYIHAASPFVWPPFWMQILYCLDRVAAFTHLPLVVVLQAFLVTMELLVTVVAYRLLLRLHPSRSPARVLLWGLALNPICILLTMQHCNFDVIVGLFALLGIGCMACYARTHDPVDWLAACLWVGLGILAKTVPFVLLPVLLFQTRRLPGRTLLFGAALAIGPVLLGMSIIYVLAPEDVTRNVLMYRSAAGAFGFSGLPALIGLGGFSHVYARCFLPALLILLVALAWMGRRDTQQGLGRRVILWSALLLLAVPTLGPGYAPQYLYWSIPLLVVAFSLLGLRSRRWMIGCYLVAALTYVVEYALIPPLGALIRMLFYENETLRAISDALYGSLPLVNLPLFAAMLTTVGLLLRAALTEGGRHDLAEGQEDPGR